MRTFRHIIAVVLSTLVAVTSISAQDITVTVTPVQQVLPPQLMLYISEPANYFNIIISNTGLNDENVYLVMQIEQFNPASGLGLSTPPKRQPKMPIVVPAGSTRALTPAEVRGLFNHIPLNEIKAPADLFSNYANGSFGLLPEGSYELHLTAYHWDLTSEPYVVSSPTGGLAYFDVCYRAQAPQFLTPVALGNGELESLNVAEMDVLAPQLTWREPVIACNPIAQRYNYSLRIVEVLPGQYPDESMDHNPVVYQITELTTPMCMIPQSVLAQMKGDKTYAAQVTATPANSNNKMLNYVSIENNGKSVYKLFRLKGLQKPDVEEETPEIPKIDEDEDKEDKQEKDEEEEKEELDEDEDEDEDSGIDIYMGNTHTSSLIEDSLYTFRNPKIVDPYFQESEGARKRFMQAGIEVAWQGAIFEGGEGMQNDTIKIEYDVQLFDNGELADKEDAMKQEPIYSFHTAGLKDTIQWSDIADKVEAGDYLVLRIKPVVVHGSSVGFTGEDNVVDFAIVNRITERYFQCSDMVEIENTKPTTVEAKELKDKQVQLGEYLMTIDEISGNGVDGFTGRGRVQWEPFGRKVMVCVKFNKMKINTDNIVYEGTAESYAGPEMSSMDAVDNLFSEWGVDNLIGDSGIPYANQLQGKATDAVKSLAEKIDLGNYYKAYQDGKNLYKFITGEDLDEVYMPIAFPQEVLPKGWDVVDIQIAGMKFAPTHATMSVIGESILPECDVLKSKILVFGAPRLCISPTRFLPESGHIALLGDFTLAPSSDFEMTFKAPHDVLEPKDGCYISWHSDTLELLGIDMEMKVAGIVKDVNGQPTTERPIIKAQASFGSWNDFMVDNLSIEDFQVEDLPGWTFTAKNIVYDHSVRRNSPAMGAFPERYSKTLAGIKGNDESWQGLHIGSIGIKFPSSLEIGDTSDEERRLTVHGEEMFFDNSGVTLKMGAEEIFQAKEGKMGGWGISLDKAVLQIIQDDFDNCMFAGQLNVPLFGTKGDDKEEDDKFGNIDYTCEIRRLTDPRPRSALSEAAEVRTGEERTRYSYVFLTEQVEDLNFNCFVADVDLDHKQTYFLIEAYDDEKEDKINTQVELCIGGTISIGGVDDANAWLKEKTASLPLELKIPDIHFTKMRLSNVKRSEWVSISELGKKKQKEREAREKEVIEDLKDNLIYLQIAESEEMELGEGFYLDLGEWSLASAKKRLGPFSFSLDKFSPTFKDSRLEVEISGTIGLIEDKINVGATVAISAEVKMDGADISNWSISDGDVDFRGLSLDLDFTAIHLKGELEVIKEGPDKGYDGNLTIDITGLFALECEGGYYEHEADESSEKGMKEEGVDLEELDAGDKKYSWGYFKVSLSSSTGIRIDPIIITRISGGFFFNCRPTAGEDSGDGGYNVNKFNGDPEPCYGNIGIALGMTLATSAGEKALSGDMDLLVCYDNQNKCLSTFMFNGHLKALGGIVNADASLIYENQKSQAGTTMNRYLCLNITVEAGADTKELIAEVKKANKALEDLKAKMDEFQQHVDNVANKMTTNPEQGLKQLSGDYEENENGAVAEGDTGGDDDEVKAKDGEAMEGQEITAMKTKISLEFKVTWVKDGKEYTPPRWHLYLGEPAKDKRCSFTFLKFNSSICTVDIGADAYLCIGNELPDNGVLPPIPTKITEFLSGHKSSSTDMDASLAKAERSRKRAAQALLGNDVKGGVMVGASAWGYINIDLGLLYGSLDALAGFDVSMINYGNSAFCVNSGSSMGKNGWYAMGQFYAYLAAELGIHVKIGRLIDEKIEIFSAGIGGVLEIGLPNPTWVDGQARIKISLLGGLCKINKKFEFSAGDHCVPFKGNALDGFEMFQDVSLGSDSLYQALMDPTFAISKNEANNMTFTTTSSIGSHYRLLDPSWVDEMVERAETTEEDLAERIAMNASRTYVFDMDQNLNENGMKMGVRLFDLGTEPTEWLSSGEKISEADFYERMGRTRERATYDNMREMVASYFDSRDKTVCESSMERKGRDLSKGIEGYLHTDAHSSNVDQLMSADYVNPFGENVDLYGNSNSAFGQAIQGIIDDATSGIRDRQEVNVSFREDRGTTFHLTDMNLKPGHSYAMILCAEAFEIENGRRVWCYYVDADKNDDTYIQWRQHKAWFFRVKSDEEEKIITDSLRDLQPYIALAYPSTDGSRVVDTRGEGSVTAYFDDIMHPTIALNRDLQTALPTEKMQWVLSAITQSGDTITQVRNAKYIVDGSCINLEPESNFDEFSVFSNAQFNAKMDAKEYDFNTELYHLELRYSYERKARIYDFRGRPHQIFKDSTFNLVDLMLTSLPHGVQVGNRVVNDSWLQTTTRYNTELLPYTYPFVGASIYKQPVIDYESDYVDSDGKEKMTDVDHVFENTKYSAYNKPYRLIDPYMYLAYLGKWVFIGDREISPYDWDEVGCKFASESLIFNYNGTVINPEFLKDVKNPSLYELRTKMYNVWNDWRYNNPDLPRYPLPMTSKTVGGLTVNNQDGKASTVTPLNINHYSDYTYCVQDLVKDYTGIYYVASDMCKKLKTHTESLVNIFFRHLIEEAKDGDYEFDKNLDQSMKSMTQYYRGRYLESSYRGYSVKVPYYQLPLIYGDCFGGDAHYGNYDLNRNKRSFNASIGGDDMRSGDPEEVNLHKRWRSEASNLLFFRLNNKGNGTFTESYFPAPLQGLIYLRDKNMYNASYVGGTGTNMEVAWDEFDMGAGLRAVSDFRANLYRVDAYDIDKGLYTVKQRGGGPWLDFAVINADNGVASNLEGMTTAIAEKEEHLRSHYDTPRIQAFLWDRDGSLSESAVTFVYTDSIYKYGQRIDGHQFYQMWHESQDIEDRAWQQKSQYITEVYIDPSMKNAELRTLKEWFQNCSHIKNIYGLEYLNTSLVTNMSSMFYGCSSLTSLRLDKFDTGKVTNMGNMFRGCNKLQSLNVRGWNTGNVTDMHGMFADCESLKEISGMVDFHTPKVTTMNGMFNRCKSLKWVDSDNFSSEALTNVARMFYGCSSLEQCNLKNLEGMNLTNATQMFDGCTSLKYVYITRLTCDDTKLSRTNVKDMFKEVPDLQRCDISYGLIDKIKDQIPGRLNPSYDNSYKAILGTYTHGSGAKRTVLIFTASKDLYQKNKSYDFYLNNVRRTIKVTEVWSGESVMNTRGIMTGCPWESYRSEIKQVHFQKSFSQSPAHMGYWFKDFTKLTKIYGLQNLNTTRVESMNSMFLNCSQLTEIDMSKFNTPRLTTTSKMFQGCEALNSLIIGYKFNTDKVTDMSHMFDGCKLLESLSLPNFNTENVENMTYMFNNCELLSNLDVGLDEFKTPKVKNMLYMFNNCKSLKRPVSVSTMENVTTANGMYRGCESMEYLNLAGMDMQNLTDITYMFGNCKALKELNLSTLNVPEPKSCTALFSGMNNQCYIYIPYDAPQAVLDKCPKSTFPNLVLIYPAYVIRYKVGGNCELLFLGSKTTLKVGDIYHGYTIDKVWSGSSIIDCHDNSGTPWSFDHGAPVISVKIDPTFKNVPIVNASGYFSFYEKKVERITGLENLNVSNTKSFRDMFSGCKVVGLDLSTWNTQNATTMYGMFNGCSNLRNLKLGPNFKTDNVTNMTMMFSGCNSLTKLDLSTFNTSKVTEMSMMFNKCSNLTSLDLSKFDVSNVKDGFMFSFFSGCSTLNRLDISSLDVSKQTTMMDWFGNCSSLEEIDLSSADLSNIKSMAMTFNECTSLRKLTIGSLFSPANLKKDNLLGGAFKGVHDLVVVTPAETMEAIRTAFVDNLEFVEGVTGTFYDKDPGKEVQAIWTSNNKTLTFYYGAPVGDYFNGQMVSRKWTGNSVLDSKGDESPWQSTVAKKVTKVVFDASFANARPTSTKAWFSECSNLTDIENLNYLNTSDVTDMSYMFNSCSALKSIDISNFNTSKTTDMAYMFYGTAVDSLDVSNFNTANVTDMTRMFAQCEDLTSLDLTKFNTTKVTSAASLFNLCMDLKKLKLGQNCTFDNMSKSDCFGYVRNLDVLVHSSHLAAVEKGIVNNLGFKEGTHGTIIPYDKRVAQAIWVSALQTLYFTYSRQYSVGEKFKGYNITKVWSGTDVTNTPYNASGAPWCATVGSNMKSVEFQSSFADVHPQSGSGWFQNCKGLKNFYYIENLKTDKMASMNSMFKGCSQLTTLDISHFKTSSCGNMGSMFMEANALQSLDLTTFDVSNVSAMSNMFNGCTSLEDLKVNNWRTSNLQSMSNMFDNCISLTSLDISQWDVSKVKYMSSMFHGCKALTSLDVSKWNTIKAENMMCMFQGCTYLKDLNVSNFITSNVTNMTYMFYECANLTSIGVNNWNVSKVTNFAGMFYGCKNVQSFSLSRWNTSNAKDMSYMFYGCSRAIYLDTSNWNTSQVTNMESMFSGCSNMDSAHLKGWNTQNVTNFSKMFKECTKMTMISNCENLNSQKVESMNYMFYGCAELRSINLEKLGTSKVTGMTSIFAYCKSLRNLYLSGKFITSKIAKTQGFSGDYNVRVHIMNTTSYSQARDKNTVIDALKKLSFTDKVTGTLELGSYGGQKISF